MATMALPITTTIARPPDPWKVRWCGRCRQYEYDVGAYRGWVKLQGAPDGVALSYLRQRGEEAGPLL